jgi:hypothetical protein
MWWTKWQQIPREELGLARGPIPGLDRPRQAAFVIGGDRRVNQRLRPEVRGNPLTLAPGPASIGEGAFRDAAPPAAGEGTAGGAFPGEEISWGGLVRGIANLAGFVGRVTRNPAFVIGANALASVVPTPTAATPVPAPTGITEVDPAMRANLLVGRSDLYAPTDIQAGYTTRDLVANLATGQGAVNVGTGPDVKRQTFEFNAVTDIATPDPITGDVGNPDTQPL